MCFVVAPAYAEFGDLLYRLSPTAPADTLHFGGSVSISGTTAIIGVGLYTPGSNGSAYLFDVTTGQQLRRLTASDGAPGDQFGKDVAIFGNTALVGAWQDDNGAASKLGKAYLFDVATGQELFKLMASDGLPEDRFGGGVALFGNKAVISAQNRGAHSGVAYVFDATNSHELLKYTPSDGIPGDLFGGNVSGGSIAVSGNIAIGGARTKDDGGIYNSGAAYLFDVTTGQELFKLQPSDPRESDLFGHDVAISGDKALVGVGYSDDAGAAYLFDVTTGHQLFKFTGSGGEFGFSVALNSNTAIVCARYEPAAYLFDIETGQLLKKLTGPTDSQFGRSVAMNNNFAVIGAILEDNLQGAAYVFDISRGQALPGDFNNDSTVDAADYVVWRNGLGTTYTQSDYTAWRANFGRSVASESAVSRAALGSAVGAPEPASIALAAGGVFSLFLLMSTRTAALDPRGTAQFSS
jgi:outer membrane protein assembly factor BamB